ncbi:MAG TPA: exopolysaccharide biosynthesis polyprenyl glycosylphosphotransferase [Hyphomicrobium sp.]|nr:exopolysaccharide biosynthesis polyprenyl glycosylphosphotransferase [Hyphomicrobium sp.]
MESSRKFAARSGEPVAARRRVSDTAFALSALAFDVVVVLGMSIVSGAAYKLSAGGTLGHLSPYVLAGLLTGLLYAVPFFVLELAPHALHTNTARDTLRLFGVWTFANFVLTLAIPYMHAADTMPIEWSTLFYAVGLFALSGSAPVIATTRARLVAVGLLRGRRVMLVAHASEIGAAAAIADSRNDGLDVVAIEALPSAEGRQAILKALDDIAESARTLAVDDIVIATEGLSELAAAEAIARLSAMPVAIHVQAPMKLGRSGDMRVAHIAEVFALTVAAPPLEPLQRLAKRLFDVVVASAALIALSPMLIVIGLLIRATSDGPALFRQTRRGYNMREFRIWKFRTMTTMDDGADVLPTVSKEHRVTWFGRYLRRFNLDELPQLINVITGDMAIVGPRPHATGEDVLFAQWITAYTHRAKVRPGITGWAQVNGCRGRAATVQAIRARVEHDLHYIENWSMMFDLYIIVLTVFSPKAYRNAR